MARIAGRSGRVYMAIASGGTAEPVASLKKWNLEGTRDKYDVTCFGDESKVNVVGLRDATGGFEGFHDTAAQGIYAASIDGVARKMYLYPTTDVPTQYWFGTAFVDLSIDVPVDGPVAISGSIAAATPFFPVGL